MFIKYFIPEDGDDERCPNVFRIDENNKNATTLDKIKKQFPLSGVFVFRFLRNLNGTVVWLDAGSGTYDDSKVVIPVDNDGVLMKVTRIEHGALSSSGLAPVGASVARSVVSAPPAPSVIDMSFSPPAVAGKTAVPEKASKPPVARRGSEKLISFDDSPAVPASNAPAASASADLFGFDDSSFSNTPSHSNGNSSGDIFKDFDSMTPPPSHHGATNIDPFATTSATPTRKPLNGGGMGLQNPMGGGNNMMGGNMGMNNMNNNMNRGMGMNQNQGMHGTPGGVRPMNGNMNANTSGRGMGDAFGSLNTNMNNNGARKW